MFESTSSCLVSPPHQCVSCVVHKLAAGALNEGGSMQETAAYTVRTLNLFTGHFS